MNKPVLDDKARAWIAGFWLIGPLLVAAAINPDAKGEGVSILLFAWFSWSFLVFYSLGWLQVGSPRWFGGPSENGTMRIWYPNRAQWVILWTVTALVLLIWWDDPYADEHFRAIVSIGLVGFLLFWQVSRRP